VIDAPLAIAFTAGMVAAFNPCGFPMLPAYLSWFVGSDDPTSDTVGRVQRALVSGAAVSGGFFAVFVAIGLPVNAWISSSGRVLPWLTIAIGLLLLVLGAAMLAGFRPKVALPRLERGGRERTIQSMFVFGVSYAVASLGCSLPVFATVVAGTASRANLASGIAAFGAFAAGMSLVLLTLSLALALAQDQLVRVLRAVVRWVDAASAVLLVVAGAYLVWYGIYARSDVPAGPVAWVEDWSTRVQVWLSDGGTGLGLVLALVVAVGLALVVRRRVRARAGT
jgi:cytochrome c biogenesis protein CcdA